MMPALILKPLVKAAVDMQHHARQGATFTTLAMNSPLRLPLHPPSALQRLLDPYVSQVDLVLLRQLLVKMAHVQVKVLLPLRIQNLLGLGLRHPLAARPTTPTIQQSIVATHLISLPPATKLPVADTDNLSSLPPHDLPRAGPQQHFFYLHRPLHRGRRIALHTYRHGSIFAAR